MVLVLLFVCLQQCTFYTMYFESRSCHNRHIQKAIKLCLVDNIHLVLVYSGSYITRTLQNVGSLNFLNISRIPESCKHMIESSIEIGIA